MALASLAPGGAGVGRSVLGPAWLPLSIAAMLATHSVRIFSLVEPV